MRTRFADTLEEITRIQRRPPPMVALPLLDDTRVSRPWVNEPIHAHVGPMEHHVIAPTLRGDGFSAVRAEGRTIRTPSITGGVTIAPRGFSGDFDCDGRPLASNVFLSRARLQRAADELHSGRTAELLPRLNFDDPRLFSILQLISSESSHPGLHARLWFEQLVDLLCLQLLRAHSVFPASAAEGGAGLARWQVQRVTGYMMDRLGEPLGLQELADLVGLSRFHFCKAFRIASGFTPHQWLVRRRMDEARRLLRETALSITEVALTVGYQTPSAFTHAFRSRFGLSPTDYRRRL